MENYIKLLSTSTLFQGVREEEIRSVLHCLMAVKKEYPKESYILRMGDTTSSVGLVLSGRVLLIQEDLWGRRNIITKVSPGEVFAEPFAASEDAVVNVSVVAENDCAVLWININRILSICPSACSHHTQIIRNLVSLLAKKAMILNSKITHMSRRSTREKLLSYLSSEAIRQKKLTFDIEYDRQQLADFLCVDRSAMSVELSKLQKEGTLKYHRNHFSLSVDCIDPIG
ncbi:MAG: Crp/Fnr family transcriptional regulator [Eubacteriales bacterium]|nr:Crp/Fnr family transcriptional regulator [Eubacteriales bacterium]